MTEISNVSPVKVKGLLAVPSEKKDAAAKVKNEAVSDKFEVAKQDDCPKISRWRLFLNLLSQEQIDMINKTGKMPKGSKIELLEGGRYQVANDYIGVTNGTRTMPAGFELRKNILGFTIVVPKDTDGLFIASKK